MKSFIEIMLIAVCASLIMRLLYQCLKWIASKSLITSIILTFIILCSISFLFPSLFNFLPSFNGFTKGLIEIMLMVICGIAFMYVFYGGFLWAISGADKSNIEGARDTIISGLIAFTPFAVAQFFVFFLFPPVSLDILSVSSLLLSSLGLLLGVGMSRPILWKVVVELFAGKTARKEEAIRFPSESRLEASEAASFADVLGIKHPTEKLYDHKVTESNIKDKPRAFDVFLCHNSEDKPVVRRLAKQLQEQKIVPWLDEWELRPGLPWQPLLEEQIGQIMSAAVCVGEKGVGPWQQQELNAFLREFVDRGCPVIPVILSNAPSTPKLPIFLKSMTWVDFRIHDPDPMKRLIWGITGERKEGNDRGI